MGPLHHARASAQPIATPTPSGQAMAPRPSASVGNPHAWRVGHGSLPRRHAPLQLAEASSAPGSVGSVSLNSLQRRPLSAHGSADA
jgi:hypothetical protein